MTNVLTSELPKLSFSNSSTHIVFAPSGDWTLPRLALIIDVLPGVGNAPLSNRTVLDGTQLDSLDSAGAFFLLRAIDMVAKGISIELVHFQPQHEQIFKLVRSRVGDLDEQKKPRRLGIVETLGKATLEVLRATKETITFFGETAVHGAQLFVHPARFRAKEFFVQLELGTAGALPVVALVTFLIGTVVAYLTATQIEQYGANIFIVDGVAMSMGRELSPLIVAVVMAGRSGSAFTAQIGSMRLNDEVSAIQTLGLSPVDVLVLPRIMALVIAMPMLVFVGDIVGMAGGAFIANVQLDITPSTFIDRLKDSVPLKHFIVGLIKAPVFAYFIALIGCRRGLTVEKNARSVGLNTTATVVESIVLVILLDAFFAVLFMELGI